MPDDQQPSPKYGLALIAILFAVIASAFADQEGWAAIFSVFAMGVVLIFVLSTSGVRRGLRHLAIALTVLGVGAGVVGILVGESGSPTVTSDVISVLMAIAVPAVILRTLRDQMVISFTTVAGALCIYLLIGFAFSLVYRNLSGGAMFVGVPQTSAIDAVYFSYTTLTTVGYGDLAAATDAGRLVAISEALIGQLYLVSVVALVVSRVGSPRTRVRGKPSDDG